MRNPHSLKSSLYILFTLALIILPGCQSNDQEATPSSREEQGGSVSGSFELNDDGDALPPQMIDRKPRRGQKMLPEGPITIIFDQDMNQQATNAAWSLLDAEGEAVEGEIEWLNFNEFTFVPATPLTSGATYKAKLAMSAGSASGITLVEPLSLDFDVIEELQVSQVFPSDGTDLVESGALITVMFNRPVVPLGIVEERDLLPDPLNISPPISGKGEWLNTSVYIFTPDEPMRGSTNYTATVARGLSDMSGTTLSESYIWEFATVRPSVHSIGIAKGHDSLKDYQRHIALNETFVIEFRQPMDPDSVADAFSIMDPNDLQIKVSYHWNEEFTTVEITPIKLLALDTRYTLQLSSEAKDSYGAKLDNGLLSRFTTVLYPGIKNFDPIAGSSPIFFNNKLEIYFDSPMDMDTLFDHLEITPQPNNTLRWSYNSYSWRLNIYGLEPSTHYEVRVLPGMRDVYGNRITETSTLSFDTGRLRPSAWLTMSGSPVLFQDQSDQSFFASSTNVEYMRFSIYDVTLHQFGRLNTRSYRSNDFKPTNSSLVHSWKSEIDSLPNQDAVNRFSLQTPDGESLPLGLYYLGMNAGGITPKTKFLSSRYFIVANVNLTVKSTPTETLVWATDIQSGKPISGLALMLYSEEMSLLETGQTDKDGLYYLDGHEDVEFVYAKDSKHLGFARITWSSGASAYDFGIGANYFIEQGEPIVYVYTDRPLYRPGQSVSFKGVMRFNDDLDYSLPTDSYVRVSIESFDEEVYEKTLRLSDFGSFSGELLLDTQAALGRYQIEVRYIDSGDLIGSVNFSVAEYRKPEFQTTLSPAESQILSGGDMLFNLKASYFSGGSVSGANVEWELKRSTYYFRPGGEYHRFSFIDLPNDRYSRYALPSSDNNWIADGEAVTDEDGLLDLSLVADMSEVSASQTFSLQTTTSDIAGTYVSAQTSVVVHQSEIYPGVRAGSYVGQAGQEQNFEIVVLDWDGNPVPSQQVTVEIVEQRWYSVQEKTADGRIKWVSSIQEISVSKHTNISLDESGWAKVSFTPDKGGVFRATVSTRDSKGNLARASARMWVSGSNYIPWRQTNDRSFELVSDQDAYQPGETAEILIASPFDEDVYALITVERGHIRSQEVILLTSNSTVYKLPIKADMAPNIYVSVVVISGEREDAPPDFRVSMIELKVDISSYELTVELIPESEQVGPGDEISYLVRTLDHKGAPISAEVSLALVDLATLSLSAPNSSPILSHFYSDRALSVRTAVPLLLHADFFNALIEEYTQDGEESGGGGKGGGDYGVIDVREDFPDTAYWKASVVTDSDGEANLSVTLPDNLTTWRLDARAITTDTRVGQSIVDIITTKPLHVRPQTPRFFVVGDEARLGTAVHNNTDKELEVDVSIEAEGLVLHSNSTQTVTIPAGRQAYVSWEVQVKSDVERVDLIFSASAGQYFDASRPTMGTLEDQGIPVYKFQVPETVGTAGMISEGGTQIEGIRLPTTMDAEEGQLTIELAPSLSASLASGLEYLEHYPYECTEQTVSRFLPNLLTVRALNAAGLSSPELEANLNSQIEIGLQRLYNLQRADGGWEWWSGDKESHIQTSIYVVLGLVEAQVSGFQVSERVLEQCITYLQRKVKPSTQLNYLYEFNRQAFLLYVLARADSPDVSRTKSLYEQRHYLSLYGRAYLAQTLHLIDPNDGQIQNLLSDINTVAITSATGTHWEEESRDYWNWNSDVRTTAIVLNALIQIDPDSLVNPNAVRWLMRNRTGGHWRSTQETAWSLMALTNWMVATDEFESDYEYAVAMNGAALTSRQVDRNNLQQNETLHLEVADLLTDEINRLAIGRDDGPGNLYYTAHLEVDLPVEEVKSLDQGFIISRSYFAVDDDENPITEIAQGELVRARLTIVVPHDAYYIVIDDYLPAGMEAVDSSLLISQEVPRVYDWRNFLKTGWGWWYFDHVELHDEKVVISADYLPAGTYVYTYLVRATTVGEFRVIPPVMQEFYFPEVYGRGDGTLFTVLSQ